MKILFITYFFAPYNCIGAVRTTRTVEKLIEMGHDVRVITAKDQHLIKNLSSEVPEKKIIRTRWADLEKPIYSLLGHSNVLSLKSNIHKKSFKSILLNFLNGIFQRVISIPDKHIGWYFHAVHESKRTINAGWVPDVIFASATPYTSLMIAKNISKYFGIPWVGELRDLWADNHYGYGWWVDRKIEQLTLKTASALVTVSNPLNEILQKKYPKIKVSTILNAYDKKDFSNEYEIKSNSKLNIVYTGAIYSGKRDPSPLFEALNLHKSLQNFFNIDFYGNDLGYVSSLIEKYNLHDCVKVHGSVSRNEALQYQKKSSVLLLLTWDNPNEKGVLTGKLFEYIGSSKPILSIGAIEDTASTLIKENSFGVATNTPEEIVQFLQSIISNDFKIDINNRKKFERTKQVDKLEEVLYEVSKS